jgi:hypothetical protein
VKRKKPERGADAWDMPQAEENDGWDFSDDGQTKAKIETVRSLKVTVVEASNLPVPGRFNRRGPQGHLPTTGIPVMGLNPYVVVKHSTSRRNTKVSQMNAWPKWGTDFEFALESPTSAARPLRDPDLPIIFEVMNEDKFTADTLIASVEVSAAKIDSLIMRCEIGAKQTLLEQLNAAGLPLRGAGAQPALLSLSLEIIESQIVHNADKPATPRAGIEATDVRSPQKLKEDSERFFEKLNSSPLWRGRRGEKKAHLYLDAPDLPFEKFEERDAKSLLASAGVLGHQIAQLTGFLQSLDKHEVAGKSGKKSGTRKKTIWKHLSELGVDTVSLGVMFGADARTDDSIIEEKEVRLIYASCMLGLLVLKYLTVGTKISNLI